MSLWRRHRHPVAEPAPRPNRTRIAILEHELLGIPPTPGSFAAAVIGIRRAATCMEHRPVDIGTFADGPGVVMLCTGCGNHVTVGADGDWRIVTAA